MTNAEYYSRTASSYDDAQIHPDDEHYRALQMASGLMASESIKYTLDVGCGTGRGLLFLKTSFPGQHIMGVEPVKELREVAFSRGCRIDEIVPGSGESLPFADKSFDCAITLGVLHHVPNPRLVIKEMLRVARRMIVISDGNIYGWGSARSTFLKRWLRRIAGMRGYQLIATLGRGRFETDYDGVFYPFSLFDHLEWLRSRVAVSHLATTRGTPGWAHDRVSHVVYIGLLSAQPPSTASGMENQTERVTRG